MGSSEREPLVCVIEGNAVQQLEQTSKLKGVTRAVGMPDLHAGKGCPIGAAFL